MEPVLAVTFYEVSVAVHVMAIVIAFGPTFAFPIIQMTAERAFPRQLPFAWRTMFRISKGMVYPATVLVGVTGIYQAIDGPYEFDRDEWMTIGLTIYLVIFAAALWAYRPSMIERLTAAAEQSIAAAGPTGDVTLNEDYGRAVRLPNIVGAILGVLTLVVIYLMEVKPFAG